MATPFRKSRRVISLPIPSSLSFFTSLLTCPLARRAAACFCAIRHIYSEGYCASRDGLFVPGDDFTILNSQIRNLRRQFQLLTVLWRVHEPVKLPPEISDLRIQNGEECRSRWSPYH